VEVVSTHERGVSLGWDYSCPLSNGYFKVYIEHVEWKACQTGQKDTSRGPGKVVFSEAEFLVRCPGCLQLVSSLAPLGNVPV